MPATVSHVLSATTPDDPAYEIRPSHWNSAHAFTFNAEGSEISGAFSNTPGGVTFGLETNGYITAGAPAGGGGITAINVSAGVASQNLSALTFNNGGGVSFGLAASVITASVATNYQSQGAYLTTAMASNASSVFAGVGETVTTTAGTDLALTVDTNGVRIAHPAWLTTAQAPGAYLTTAMASNRGSDFMGTNTALTANGVSMTANSSGLSLNFPAFLTTAQPPGAYLTTARASNDGVGLNTAQSNVTWTVNSSGISLDGRGYAGTGTSATNASITINSNGLAISVAAGGGGADGGNTIIAGTRTAGSNSGVLFDNANGITFGLNAVGGSILTASHNALTTARASNDAVGLNTALTAGPLAWTVNSSGLSLNAGSAAGTTSGFGGNLISGSMTHNTAGLNLSLNHPAWLTTAMQSNAATISNIRVSGGTTSNLLSAITFGDANGVSFGLNAGTMTASHNGLTTAAASNHSHGNPTLALTNLSGTTASNSAGFTLSLSAGAGGGVTPVASASNGSFSFTTLAFSNANNVTFGTSVGGIITASVAAPGAAAENNWFALTGNTVGNTTASGSTIALSGGNNITLSGTNGSVIRIDAPASSSLVGTNGISISTNGSTVSISGLGVNVSAGTTSNNMTAMTFSNANGVSFGLNGSVVTGSVAPAGGGYILRDWDNAQLIGSMNLISNLTATIFSRGRPLFVPVHLHGGLSFNNAMIEVSRQTSGNNAFTINAGLYSFSNSTRIDLVGSFQNVYSGTNTASISGIRRIQMTHANTDLTSLSAGHYILALGFSAAGDSTSAMNYSIRGGLTANPPVGLIGPGSDANTTATSALSGIPLRLFRGLWSTTSAVMPASVALADVSAWTTGGHPYIWMGSR